MIQGLLLLPGSSFPSLYDLNFPKNAKKNSSRTTFPMMPCQRKPELCTLTAMKRVTRNFCEDGPLIEEQETEGQRQLHNLLVQQLDTEADLDRCVAKRKCFAPAAIYKPFGNQAAGVRSLSQFQALQDGERELARLRELGLSDGEIELWRNRDKPEAAEKSRGVCMAPGARHERLQAIWDKIEARNELLAQPQRLSASRPLSRREMEIEKALFRGSERLDFLSVLYHQEEDSHSSGKGLTSPDPLDCLYRDVLNQDRQTVTLGSDETKVSEPPASTEVSSERLDQPHAETLTSPASPPKQTHSGAAGQTSQPGANVSRPAVLKELSSSETIGRLFAAAGCAPGGPVKLTGPVEEISDEEIRSSCVTEEEIRRIPRFHNYQRGEPSKVLCVRNLSPQASVARLVSLFSRFHTTGAPAILYRLLTGRLKGQAFVTFSDAETALSALELLNGYRLLDRPLVIEFGRERRC